MDIILIAAVTVDGYIARRTNEEVRWSEDLHIFKEQTMGSPVIMGSHTFAVLKKELTGREIIVLHRSDEPAKILNNIVGEKCFVAGGGRTNSRFAPYLTHLYLTPHPLAFGSGIRLFYDLEEELQLDLIHSLPIKPGLNQLQYKVVR